MIGNAFKSWWGWVLLLEAGMLVAVGMLVWGFLLPANVAGRAQSGDFSGGNAPLVTDLNYDRKLAGLAHDVFLGQVMED